MNPFYVYGYIDTESFEPYIYIGKGTGNRAWKHLSESENPNHACYNGAFYRKLRKMKEAKITPIIEIIKDELSESHAFDLEIELIAKYGRCDNETGCLLNLTAGGDGASVGNSNVLGFIYSNEMRIKQSIATTKRNLDPAFQKIAIQGIRKKLGKSIRSFNLVTRETIKCYECMNDVELDNFSRVHVSQCCRGKRQSHGGIGWEYD